MGTEAYLITINISVLMVVCTCIVTVAGAIGVFYKLGRKVMNTDEIEHIKNCLDRDKSRLDKQDILLEELCADMKALLSAVDILLEHEKTGNSTRELAEEHKKFREHLCKKV